MAVIKNYSCEFCSTTFNSEEKATKCETTHRKPLKICSFSYQPKSFFQTQNYPNIVRIEFEDGIIQSYHIL